MKRGRDDDPIVGHLLSIYSAFKPDFAALGRAFPSLMPFLLGENKSGLDFSNPEALAELTKALLFVDFDLSVNLPPDKLCPTVTSRLNYILHISDLLKRSPRLSIKDGKYARDSFGGDSEVGGKKHFLILFQGKEKRFSGWMLDVERPRFTVYLVVVCLVGGLCARNWIRPLWPLQKRMLLQTEWENPPFASFRLPTLMLLFVAASAATKMSFPCSQCAIRPFSKTLRKPLKDIATL